MEHLTNKDFTSDQEVRWCPGCGDYAILRAMQKALPNLERKKEDFIFISGIGCSSRFPYYMNTYGFHSIHGRAPAFATGMKLANPNLSVWQITGDGDALAIGGNHFIHALRRNIDINILLFNNEIYGLTKGQFSPTSQKGIKTKSNPHGTTDTPFSPSDLAIGSQSSFFARVVDTNPRLMQSIFIEAEQHRGTSLIEILQNCVIFNDKTFDAITGKDFKKDAQLILEDGKPMIFGSEMNKGILPLTIIGFCLMTLTGLLLFYAIPVRNYQNIFFRIKILLIIIAGLNALFFHRRMSKEAKKWDKDSSIPKSMKVSAIASLFTWSLVIISGRLIAYNWFDCDRQPQPEWINFLTSCVVDYQLYEGIDGI